MLKSQFLLFFLLFSSAAFIPAAGQKVKYKDIFPLLSTKQYEQAEPFLKTYLRENTDNSNAYLFMGEIYQDKITTDDILIQTDRAIQHMDSAILYYDKTLKLLTDKELRKNKEYYESYNRRDLSTGEFGVKLDYVQFDLEKRITGLKEQIDKIKMVKYYFTNAENLYRKSQGLFATIQEAYPGSREMYLRADDHTVRSLSALSHCFDSCAKAFDNYRTSLSNYGKNKYSQRWELREIANFKSDGKEMTDFYKNEMQVWDYKSFADQSLSVIQKDVMPVQDNLVKFDMEINKLKTKLETDSVSVKSDLAKLTQGMLGEQLKKFDPSPMPIDVFTLKIADLEYKSVLIENKKAHVSDDIAIRLQAVKDEIRQLNRADSAATKLAARNLDVDVLDYQQFVKNTFTKGDILKSYVHSVKEHIAKEKERKDAEFALRLESMNWLINGSDSIPLVTDRLKVNTKFHPLVVVPDKFTSGIMFTDSLSGSGYFYSIPPSHKPDIKVVFPIDKVNMREKKLASTHAYSISDTNAQIFFSLIYVDQKDASGKYPVTLAKIYRSDGLSWSNNFAFDFIPSEINFIPDTGELIVKGDNGVTARVDKNGKLVAN
jgi:hypothetical protein